MIGAVQINNETLEANVMPSAVFSAMKYREPPHNPDKNNKNSSFTQLAHNRRCAIVKIQKYASTKRYNNISTGDNPVLISILVETNVVPHIMTVNMAILWYRRSLLLNIIVLELDFYLLQSYLKKIVFLYVKLKYDNFPIFVLFCIL